MFSCQFCIRVFTDFQAWLEHENVHMAQREAQRKNLGVPSPSNANQAGGVGGKTKGVSPQSMTLIVPRPKYEVWQTRIVETTTKRVVQTYEIQGNGPNPQYKLLHTKTAVTREPLDSDSKPQSSHYRLCFGQESDSSTRHQSQMNQLHSSMAKWNGSGQVFFSSCSRLCFGQENNHSSTFQNAMHQLHPLMTQASRPGQIKVSSSTVTQEPPSSQSHSSHHSLCHTGGFCKENNSSIRHKNAIIERPHRKEAKLN
ncbi:unnamed protein product [Sphenostylis stenocarpa]|uniref:C2H2-type domain-containing protein n=1 Tax=Sphenostylis stenocarpa TaxID=92480 RepID=A0AA86VGG1_9FABA|nr:unnamed protein product [Sphenostylis stenocarpa]